MINISSQNPNSTHSIRNKWIDGFTVVVNQSSLGGGFSGIPNNFEQLTLKGTLRRNGRDIEMFNHTLFLLVILSHLKTPVYNFLLAKGTLFNLTVSGTGLQPISATIPLRFDFGGPINLIDTDEFILEWSLNPGFWSTTSNIDAATCRIQIDETETTQIEYFVPITKSIVVEGSQDNPTYNLGDNVNTVMLLNKDKTSELIADRVVKSINFKADKFTKFDNYDELQAKRTSYFTTVNEGLLRCQNWIIYDGQDELDGVSLNCSFVSSNVTTSCNWVLWRTFYTDDWLVTRATALAASMEAKADKKGSFNANLLERDAI